MIFKTTILKNLKSGRIVYQYAPLKNIYNVNSQNGLQDFDIDSLKLDLSYPVDIVCQTSYDDSVNLILNDGHIEPKLVNSSFTVRKKNTYEVVERNQSSPTNIYNKDTVERDINLFKTVSIFPKIELKSVLDSGNLKGGNYTLYIKLADEDFNTTQIVSESGIITVYKGKQTSINSIQGTLLDEIVNKSINLSIKDIDTTFSQLYIYYRRTYSDLNGVFKEEYRKISKPYDINSSQLDVVITGLEETEEITKLDLTTQYNIYSSVQTQAEVQRMLFFGGVSESAPNNTLLQQYSYYISAYATQDSNVDLGYVTGEYKPSNNRVSTFSEYYNANHIYSYVGYWPNEWYRFGVVYIFNDDSLSPVYNLRGKVLNTLGEANLTKEEQNFDENHFEKIDVDEIFLDSNRNSKGVFQMPNTTIQVEQSNLPNSTYPLSINFKLSDTLISALKKQNIKGLFFVRQSRIPIVIAQGYSIGISKKAHIPMLYDASKGYFTESFITQGSKPLLQSNIVYTDSDEISFTVDTTIEKDAASTIINRFKISKSYINEEGNKLKLSLYRWNYNLSRYELVDETITSNHLNIKSEDDNSSWVFQAEGTEYYTQLDGTKIDDLSNLIFSATRTPIEINTYTTYIRVDTEDKKGSKSGSITVKQQKIEGELKDKNDETIKYQAYCYKYVMVDAQIQNEIDSQSKALICLDADLNPQIQSIFDGSEFKVYPIVTGVLTSSQTGKNYIPKFSTATNIGSEISVRLAYINKDTSSRIINDQIFSTRAGEAEDFTQLRSLVWNETSANKDLIDGKLIRGQFTSYLGVVSDNFVGFQPGCLYNICTLENDYTEIVTTRANNKDNFYAISNRYLLDEIRDKTINVYRGDCFTNTVSTRMIANFINSETPTNTLIIDFDPFHGYDEDFTYDNLPDMPIILSDWNAVQLGHFLTYKCLSNYHLGMRCEDTSNTEEWALLGNPRSYYPVTSKQTISKVTESTLLNMGYSTTLPGIPYFEWQNVPYERNNFDNRIAFSNVSVQGAFRNDYRIFQGLSYGDVETKYGAITKLISYGTNLFCVFEHGCAIIPINEKALLSTTTGQSIHMYGAGVLQNQVTAISEDYGSIWKDSVILTPNGIYGVDTFAKKIWRFNSNGFSIISDMLVQRYLNENIILDDTDLFPTIGLLNVKTHYNNYKGDVMFTFYNHNKSWNLCYNERLSKWVTRYSWLPIMSDNIQNQFVSLDYKRIKPYGIVQRNQSKENSIWIENLDKELDRNTDNLFSHSIEKINNISKKLDINYSYYSIGDAVATLEDAYYYTTDEQNQLSLEDIVSSTYHSTTNTYLNISYPQNSNPEIADSDTNIKITNFVFWMIFKVKAYLYNNLNDVIKVSDSLILNTSDSSSELYYSNIISNIKNTLQINPEVDDSEYYKHICLLAEQTLKILSEHYNDLQDVNKTDLKNCFDNCTFYIHSEHRDNYNKYLESLHIENYILIDLVEFTDYIALLYDYNNEENINDEYKLLYEKYMRTNLYIHGKAGSYTNIDNTNILPTHWYNRQEPFEFEFVINQPQGLHKIFNNLVIISNNVEPNSLEFTLIGDAYTLNKELIYKNDAETVNNTEIFTTLKNAEIIKDSLTNQYYIQLNEPVKNIKNFGRRLGNIEYKEDKWNFVIPPLTIQRTDGIDSIMQQARLRDKWIKIRVKYTGDKLAIISAILTFANLSYA